MEQPGTNYFFDIPVYRCPYSKYEKELEEEKEKTIQYFMGFPDSTREKAQALYIQRSQYKDRTSWRFNQIIGYLCLYVEFGKDAIKVEYWRIEQKRIPRIIARKKFVWRGWNINEIHIVHDMPSSEIYQEILLMLAEIGEQDRFKGRYIDLSNFTVIGDHVDWRALVNS